MPKLVLVLGASLIAAGVLWHGVTVEALDRFWRDLAGRPTGPMALRFILQPSMAAIAAIHDGVKDARAGRAPYWWTVVRNSHDRVERLSEGLTATARIILLGLAMDVIYQYLVFKTFYPAEALVVALLLAFVPYLLIRGPATRIVRWRRRTGQHPMTAPTHFGSMSERICRAAISRGSSQ
jgi:hypothetical protein